MKKAAAAGELAKQFYPYRHLLYIAIILVVFAVAYYALRGVFKDAAKKSAENEAAKDPNSPAAQAVLLRRYGVETKLLNFNVTVKTSEILLLATKIKNLDEVAKRYNDLYQNSLIEDLNSSLGDEDFTTFMENYELYGKNS
jgi:hypothetical protein